MDPCGSPPSRLGRPWSSFSPLGSHLWGTLLSCSAYHRTLLLVSSQQFPQTRQHQFQSPKFLSSGRGWTLKRAEVSISLDEMFFGDYSSTADQYKEASFSRGVLQSDTSLHHIHSETRNQCLGSPSAFAFDPFSRRETRGQARKPKPDPIIGVHELPCA